MPIPKPGEDPTNPTNYHHIALTSCICKTIEGMINRRLVWYLESHNLLTNVLYLQYASKIKSLPKHPTHDAVLDI